MTVRQIAGAAGCNHKTVRDVAARLYPDRARNGIRQEFSAHESFEIMAQLPKRNMVEPSQKREGALSENGKRRYSAAIIREYRLTFGTEAAKALFAELGFAPSAPANTVPFPALPAPIDAEYAALRQALGDQGTRTVLAVAYKVAIKHQGEAEADKKQGRLL